MKDMYGDPPGSQSYLLPVFAYNELKTIQGALLALARITYDEEDVASGRIMLVISRSQLHFLFRDVSEQIGRALERVSREECGMDQSQIWQ